VKHAEKIAPVAALVSAVSCMACCLPLGFAAAAGVAGLAAVLDPIRPWLMAISGVLLAGGLWQLYRRPRVCRPRSRTSLVIFWTCAAVVAALMVAPQLVAGLLADL
jgi:ABC-type Fe3+ transport system permease subunit